MICVTGEGFHKVLVTRFMERRKQLTLAMKEAMKPQEPKTKNFIPKCPELPVLASYEGVFSEEIWKMWPSFKPQSWNPESWINGDKLLSLAKKVGIADLSDAIWAAGILRDGADTGIRGAARLPTGGGNQPSAYEHGNLLADSLASWIKQELMAGPYDRDEIPWVAIKISPMSIQVKPSGAGRIIVDMSFPHLGKEVKITGDVPMSPNSGIELSDFPSKMSGTSDILAILTRHGPGAVMTKQDWSDAYKHIHVRPCDIPLQCVSFGGKYFIDRSVTFGCKSSPGIYDRTSGVVMTVARVKAGVRKYNCAKCLDDCCHIGSREDSRKFYDTYKEVSEECGVRLAPSDDPDKCFGPSTAGTILGVFYNTEEWWWTFCSRKIDKILIQLYTVVESESVDSKLLESLSGKLTHYKDIVSPCARWERGFLVYLATSDGKKGRKVRVTELLRDQLKWWIRAIWATKTRKNPIPSTTRWFKTTFIRMHPDAAGGSLQETGRGFGGVFWDMPGRPMFYGCWPHLIQSDDRDENGVRFARKLTFLEGVAAAAGLAAGADIIRNSSVVVYTDNQGLARAWKAAHSRCEYTYSVMKCIFDMMRYLNVQLRIVWTPRCSGGPELVADHLSKSKFREALEVANVADMKLLRIPRTLLKWLTAPKPARVLGYAVCDELAETGQVLPREPEDRAKVEHLRWRPGKVDSRRIRSSD